MKELSIEEKAARYDEVIEKAKMEKEKSRNLGLLEFIDENFPELKSEDERIRKEIIDFATKANNGVTSILANNYNFNKWLAWLEKQGEQQKPTDKVEPKFHESDWVFIEEVKGYKNGPFQIKTVDSFCYSFDEYHTIPFMYEDLLSKWTIQDAKDGDVLCCESGWTCIFKALNNHINTFSSYCFMDRYKWFCNTGSECHTLNKEFTKVYNGEIKPATKEQRDLLFQKMKEAGYEWDADKKELKKIEQNPAWGEEDERIYQSIMDDTVQENQLNDEQTNWLKDIKYRYFPQPKSDWSEEDASLYARIQGILSVCKSHSLLSPDLYKEMCDWLKSLKERNK